MRKINWERSKSRLLGKSLKPRLTWIGERGRKRDTLGRLILPKYVSPLSYKREETAAPDPLCPSKKREVEREKGGRRRREEEEIEQGAARGIL